MSLCVTQIFLQRARGAFILECRRLKHFASEQGQVWKGTEEAVSGGTAGARQEAGGSREEGPLGELEKQNWLGTKSAGREGPAEASTDA